MDRDLSAAQAHPLSALQGGRHADSPWLFARLRRQRPPARDSPGAAGLLQQPLRTARLRAHFQCLVRGQNPSAEPEHRHAVAVPYVCRRRQHTRSHPRCRLPSQCQNLAAPLETVRPGPKQDPHGTGGAVPAARTAGSNRAPAGSGASPRPCASRLPRRQLPYGRLPTCHAHLLRVGRCLGHTTDTHTRDTPHGMLHLRSATLVARK